MEDPRPLYADRPEWSDINPKSQYENVNPVAPIFYTDEYKDATDYFRGVVLSGEKSSRVLDLTEHIIRQNPAHYSAWQYRYQTLIALNASLDDELLLMDELATAHLKTYQVWHHRRLLITQTRNPGPELKFIERSLNVDAKNYHTWSYRQWLLAYFADEDLWVDEIPFVEKLLKEDIRNNSAWHHRFFTVFQCGNRRGDEDRDLVIKRELIFVKECIAKAPNNASAWNYLRGVLDHNSIAYSTLQLFITPYTVPHPATPTESEVVDLENPLPSKSAHLPCAAAIEFLADIYEDEGGEGLTKAVELWRSLADKYDKIRKNYWEHRIRGAGKSD